MTDYLDRDIEATEARLAQLQADRTRREEQLRERQAEQTFSDTRNAVRQEGEDRFTHDFAARFNNAPLSAYGERMGISPRDVDRFAMNRFTSHIRGEILFWHQLQNRPMSDFTRGGEQ